MAEQEKETRHDEEAAARARVPPLEVGQRVQLVRGSLAADGCFATVTECWYDAPSGEWLVGIFWHPTGLASRRAASELKPWRSFDKREESNLVKFITKLGHTVTDRELRSLQQLGLIESIGKKGEHRAVYLTKHAKYLAEMFKSERGVLRTLKAAVRTAPTRDGIRKDLESYLRYLKRPLHRTMTGALWRDNVILALTAIIDGVYDPKEYERGDST